ncbi:DeoR/GlpR family DNA-binding transcription regulator [Planococcus shenhongbingii]|uniref:DeoR/GlpR family DNA-binding transcription regulator n=1 Tax=Planococcus shenhongbingii TaxID=3058398 RepID=A0ABT8NEL3_9BACL|nr:MULTISPECIES: DeoR/GlpR family DNA-binding transcription regulator [unclassified Planococcus (in: firmicutes)]MDN7246341.1 DeoR/GlpR family DNA-binding transcription regulator [Planococcus sp. N017]WKA59345.1 DeoR/GlpR family DNA-binding transcription regulator [Planococcus sp. N016]
MTFSKLERFHYILNQLLEKQRISVGDIAEQLEVAPETIRRDLGELEERKLLTRVHGGAVHFVNLRVEPQFKRKMDMQKEAKRQIAKVAASRIIDGDTIGVDTGSTTVYLADYLDGLHNLTVVTNSLAAAERFNLALEEGRITGKVILLGGITNPAQASVAGSITIEWLNKMNLDKAFLSCGGIKDGTVFDFDMDESLVSSKMLERSGSRILMADASKIGQQSFYSICGMDELSEVLCDGPCPKDWPEYEQLWTVVEGGIE